MSRRTPRPLATAGAAAMITLSALAVACGGGEDASTAGAGDGGFPVSIDHRFGTTVVESPPARIVSLSPQWTDVLLALDVQPVGVDEALGGIDGRYPWQGDLADDATIISTADGLPYEQVAALRPDLILVTHAASDREVYDALAEIAPTVALLGDRQVDHWEDLAEVAGRFLDRTADAAAMTDDVHARIDAVADELPELDGRTFLLVNHLPGDSMWVVADPDDGASALFGELGMSIPADMVAAADGSAGRVQLSLEQVEMLDADLLIMLNNGGDPTELIGYEQLPAVRAGAVVDIELADVVALNTPTPLGVVYALDVIGPALEAAAR